MRRCFALLICLTLCSAAVAEEIDGEVSLSFVDPNEHLMPGFYGSFRPEFLEFGNLSLGAGLGLNISGRFNYKNIPSTLMPDSTNWYYYSENFVELMSFDFFAEARWRFFEMTQGRELREWVTLSCGFIINSATRSKSLTNYELSPSSAGGDSVADYRHDNLTFNPDYRVDPYISPGVLVGVGNFIFGYRHWFYFDQFDIPSGKPARMVGTLRIGYRFTW